MKKVCARILLVVAVGSKQIHHEAMHRRRPLRLARRGDRLTISPHRRLIGSVRRFARPPGRLQRGSGLGRVGPAFGQHRTLQRADQIDCSEGRHDRDWFAPIMADAEAGFGGPLNAFEIMKAFIEAGAAGVHYEDQLASEKKCGHLGGKVLVPVQQFIRVLNAARLGADPQGGPPPGPAPRGICPRPAQRAVLMRLAAADGSAAASTS